MESTRSLDTPALSYDDSTVETLLLEMTSSTFEIQRQLESVATLQDAALISFWERARKPSTKPPSLFVHLSKLFFFDLRYFALRHPWQQPEMAALEEQIFYPVEHVRILTLDIQGETAMLPLAFVISESFDPSSSSRLWFYSLQEGLQAQGDERRFIDRMTLRLCAPAAGDPLVQPLPHGIKQRLAQGQAPQLTLVPLSESPFRSQVDDIRQALREVPVQDLLQQRLATRFRQHRRAQLPEWLRFLQGEERTAYELRERAAAQCQQRVDEHLQGTASIEDYAATQIAAYIAQAMGAETDAGQLRVRVRHVLDVEDETIQGEREMSLVQWVLSGGYPGSEFQAQIIDAKLAAQLTPDFLQRMIDELGVRLSYRQALQSSYLDGSGPQLMSDVVNARLALSALAARYQGFDREACDALEAARNHTGALAALGIDAGAVILEPLQLAFKDMLYLSFGSQDTHRFLLYAPGAPEADLRVFSNVGQLSLEIARWALTDQGQTYLLGQVPVNARMSFSRFLKQTQKLPGTWSRQTVALERWPDASWPRVLSQVAFRKVSALLEQQQLATPQWFIDASRVQRQQLSHVDAQLGAIQDAYQQLNTIEPFAKYAHRQVQDWIKKLLPASDIDPDTVLVELEDGDIKTLTRTVIEGYDSSFNFADFARITSTIGQDLSRLDRPSVDGYIRSAKLGERYIQMIRRRLLDPVEPQYKRRRLLHRELLRLQIRRAWLSESMAGRLTSEQSGWLGIAVDKLVDLEPAVVGGERTSGKNGLFQLALRGRRVEGVYLFRNVSQSVVEDLVYTPDAPDDLIFRTPQALALQWEALQDYFYLRVSIDDQPAIGSLIDSVERAADGQAMVLEAISDYKRVTDLAHEFDVMVERIIADVDADTTSVAERIWGILFEVAIGVAAILSIPFPPATLALNVVLTLRSFVQGALAYEDGDRASALKWFVVTAVGVVSISGVAGRFAKALSKLSKGPGSPTTELLKKLVADLGKAGSETVSSVGEALDDELTLFLKYLERTVPA
ncbi:hypothetical protein HFV04_011155 [Pseudomonas sp. BIGb0427]|uniref:hypothetical protein n=1 Tax=unclassified Pseudomonas TaxID=196821 RepID=UPI0018A7024E|nr:hypothetical protein [Pseudomonas sp. BIGb0427]QPG65298.1 hypothetical protein HFV04_011155 [Pseudomonas sp. BIGb0427]